MSRTPRRLLWLPACVSRRRLRDWMLAARAEAHAGDTARRKLAKANLWNDRHRRKCERLREQITCDQVYINALEEHVPLGTITHIREQMRPLREAARTA